MCAGTLALKGREAISWPLSNPLFCCHGLIKGSLLYCFGSDQGSPVSLAEVSSPFRLRPNKGKAEIEMREASNECSTISE